MQTRATGTFTVDSWEPEPYDEADGATLARVQLKKTFGGDLVGTSVVEMLSAQAQDGSAAYVALERITGTVHGRSGTFVLQHCATMTGGGGSGSWTVVPGSGTGELRGLRGSARLDQLPEGGHMISLEYELS
jgi:hypothetical protein